MFKCFECLNAEIDLGHTSYDHPQWSARRALARRVFLYHVAQQMNYTPFVMGSGRAARAMREAMRVVEIAVPEISFLPLRQLARGESPKGITAGAENPILFIANPHGLHAPSILEADSEGYQLIVVEKPAAVSLDEVRALSRIKTPVAVCHGYRQMWGVQTLRRQVEAGEFGQIIAVEGRYWQSSSAQSSMAETKSPSWKNDPRLGGTSDTLIDRFLYTPSLQIHKVVPYPHQPRPVVLRQALSEN